MDLRTSTLSASRGGSRPSSRADLSEDCQRENLPTIVVNDCSEHIPTTVVDDDDGFQRNPLEGRTSF